MAAGKPGPVIPERYVEALGGVDPIVSQEASPKRVARLIHGLNEAQLSKRPAPGKWSIKEIIAHLADGEIILGSRIRFIAAHDRPPIQGYDQDAFVERLGTEKAKTKELLEAFAAVRRANVMLLKRLPKEAFSRVGLHSERGEESIEMLLHMYAGHDRIHEQQIETIRLACFPRRRRAKVAKKKVVKPVVVVKKRKKRGKKG